MKKILVPTDFSESALNALKAAIHISKAAKAEINLIHILEITPPVYGEFAGANYDMTSILREQAEQQLATLKQEMLADYSIDIHTALNETIATVPESISKTSLEHEIDLIVMGTTGAGNVLDKLWGSQTASVIGNSKIPVLAIPIDYRLSNPAKILLATNHFEKDAESCRILALFTKLFNSTLHVVVFTNEMKDKAVTAISRDSEINRYREFLDDFFHEHVTSQHLFGEDFEETLSKYISENNIDILTMFTYKRSFLQRLMNPSKTKRMSYHTKVPLLAIPHQHTDT